MSFENITGQPDAVALLRKYAASRPPQALVFAGPEGCGRKETALEFARVLNCDSGADTPRGCECRSCSAARSGNHPSVILADGEYQRRILEKEIKEFSIDTVRAIQKALSLKLARGRRTVVIADDAHKLSREAANSFLKTLEEPSSSATLILICRSKRELPRTVVSRCQSVFFRPLSDADVESVLLRLRPSCPNAGRIARASSGSISRALLFEERGERYKELKIKFDRLDLVEFKNEDLGGFLDYMTVLLRPRFTSAPSENLFLIEALHDARRLAAAGVNKNMILAGLHASIRGI